MTLVFGCRRPDEDHLYREEMLEMAQKGVLHEVHTAYSRLPGQPKVNAAAARAVGGTLKAQSGGCRGSPRGAPCSWSLRLSSKREAVTQPSKRCCEAIMFTLSGEERAPGTFRTKQVTW